MTSWLIRKTGSNTNGGTSASVRSTGTDGLVAPLAVYLSSLSANWTSADVGQGVYTSGYAGVSLINSLASSKATGTITTTSGSPLVTSSTNLFATAVLGQAISGPGIPANAYITVISSSSSIQISANAGAGAGTGTGTIGATVAVNNLVAGVNQTWTVGGAWLTLNNALVTAKFASNVQAGDTVYMGAGTYRETVAVAKSGSAGSPISVVGDVTGQYTGDAGQVTLSAYTTNDKTAPSGSNLLGLNTQSYLSFSNLTFIGGTVSVISCLAGGHDYTFTDCVVNAIYPNVTCFNFTGSATAPTIMNITLDRCIGVSTSTNVVTLALPTTSAGTADYDANILIRNCFLMAFGTGNPVRATASGTLTFKPGGIRVIGCSLLGYQGVNAATASQFSTTIPAITVSNCLVMGGASGLVASTAGQVVESYNLIYSSSPYSNVLAGTGSVSNGSYAPLVELGQSRKWAGQFRPFMRPDGTSSPLEGFSAAGYSNNSTVTTSTSSVTIGTGSQTFTVASGLSITAGDPVFISGGVTGTNANQNMTGTVTSYSGTTLVVNITSVNGSGTLTNWYISVGFYPKVDWNNRPRPSGGGSANAAVGYFEVHDFSTQDTVTYPSGQTSSGKLVGPGDQDLLIPVDATSTTVQVQLNQGSGYTGTNYATAQVLSNGELGVSGQTLTCSSSLSSWQTLTFSAFTPSKSGWITLRITSYDTSGTGTLNFGAVL